jgi:hypothetical protein
VQAHHCCICADAPMKLGWPPDPPPALGAQRGRAAPSVVAVAPDDQACRPFLAAPGQAARPAVEDTLGRGDGSGGIGGTGGTGSTCAVWPNVSAPALGLVRIQRSFTSGSQLSAMATAVRSTQGAVGPARTGCPATASTTCTRPSSPARGGRRSSRSAR